MMYPPQGEGTRLQLFYRLCSLSLPLGKYEAAEALS